MEKFKGTEIFGWIKTNIVAGRYSDEEKKGEEDIRKVTGRHS